MTKAPGSASKEHEFAVANAKAALTRMAKLDIAPTPANFTVWYHYHAGTNQDLIRTVDALLREYDEISEEQCHDVYERFFSFDQESANLHAAVSRIERAMEKAAGFIGEAGADAAEFGRTLAGASGKLTGDAAAGAVREIVDGIIQTTREMEARTQELEKKLAASSMEVTNLREEVEATRREATTDGLTGIANRKMFDLALRAAAAEAEEAGRPMCLLMADIDHFKRFNDAHGHVTGDQVLRLLAVTLTESIKGRDTAARYGGEEFAVILPYTALANAVSLADHIRERLATKKIVNRRTGERLGSITLSIGAAEYVPGEPVSQLITRADAALYVAKREGRNRVMSEAGLKDTELTLSQ